MTDLKPNIHFDGFEYSAYVPYICTQTDDVLYPYNNTHQMSLFLDLPTGEDKWITYTYLYDDSKFEVGFCHRELNVLIDRMKKIKLALVSKGYIVYDKDDYEFHDNSFVITRDPLWHYQYYVTYDVGGKRYVKDHIVSDDLDDLFDKINKSYDELANLNCIYYRPKKEAMKLAE
jgi:hypothetical protein